MDIADGRPLHSWNSRSFKGELSWSETGMSNDDDRLDLKKLCGLKKKSKSKACLERI